MTRPRCTKSVVFSSASEALAEVESCRGRLASGNARRRECAVHPCVEHEGWHLTSNPASESITAEEVS